MAAGHDTPAASGVYFKIPLMFSGDKNKFDAYWLDLESELTLMKLGDALKQDGPALNDETKRKAWAYMVRTLKEEAKEIALGLIDERDPRKLAQQLKEAYSPNTPLRMTEIREGLNHFQWRHGDGSARGLQRYIAKGQRVLRMYKYGEVPDQSLRDRLYHHGPTRLPHGVSPPHQGPQHKVR